MIIENGGCVSPYLECGGFQILPNGNIVSSRNYQHLLQNMTENYFVGPIYLESWIEDCIREKRFINQTSQHWVSDPKGGKKISSDKKKSLYTILEVMEIWNEVQRIKKDVNTYKFKGNLASRALWSKVEMLGNIPDRTGESMRNFFKQWKSKTITQSLEKIWDEKKMRFA
jgi:hypothetical protein